jgi:hypothetical protein
MKLFSLLKALIISLMLSFNIQKIKAMENGSRKEGVNADAYTRGQANLTSILEQISAVSEECFTQLQTDEQRCALVKEILSHASRARGHEVQEHLIKTAGYLCISLPFQAHEGLLQNILTTALMLNNIQLVEAILTSLGMYEDALHQGLAHLIKQNNLKGLVTCINALSFDRRQQLLTSKDRSGQTLLSYALGIVITMDIGHEALQRAESQCIIVDLLLRNTIASTTQHRHILDIINYALDGAEVAGSDLISTYLVGTAFSIAHTYQKIFKIPIRAEELGLVHRLHRVIKTTDRYRHQLIETFLSSPWGLDIIDSQDTDGRTPLDHALSLSNTALSSLIIHHKFSFIYNDKLNEQADNNHKPQGNIQQSGDNLRLNTNSFALLDIARDTIGNS